MNSPTSVQKQLGVPERMDMLEKSVSVCQVMAGELEARLAYVMKPYDTPKEASPGPPKPVMSPLADRIIEVDSCITAICTSLKNLLDRLEV